MLSIVILLMMIIIRSSFSPAAPGRRSGGAAPRRTRFPGGLGAHGARYQLSQKQQQKTRRDGSVMFTAVTGLALLETTNNRELEYRMLRLHSPVNSRKFPEIFGDLLKNKTSFLYIFVENRFLPFAPVDFPQGAGARTPYSSTPSLIPAT